MHEIVLSSDLRFGWAAASVGGSFDIGLCLILSIVALSIRSNKLKGSATGSLSGEGLAISPSAPRRCDGMIYRHGLPQENHEGFATRR
jgi:hypothetical protein